MLEFINNNGILVGGICTILTAIITALGTLIGNNWKSKRDALALLQKELDETKAELRKYTSIDEMEKSLDKSSGSIYVETLPSGKQRNICGYCWENHHSKIPLIMSSYYSEEERRVVEYGNCGACKASCYYE